MGFREETVASRPKQKAQTLFDRIAYADPKTQVLAQTYLAKHGIAKASSPAELSKKLKNAYNLSSGDVLEEFVNLHPDKKLFELYYESKVNELKDKNVSSDNGMNVQYGMMSYDNALSQNQSANTQSHHISSIALVAMVGIVGLLIIKQK